MSKYNGELKDGKLIISKSNEKLADDNKKLSEQLDYITKEELISAIKLLAQEISQLKGEPVDIQFTYDNKKNKI